MSAPLPILRILLVDADRDFSQHLVSELSSMGCEVTWVSDAKACLEQARRRRPQLILLAARVGRLSGLAICDELKRDANLRRIPLILMAHDLHAGILRHRASQTRAEVYMRRDPTSVLARVDRTVRDWRDKQQRAKDQPSRSRKRTLPPSGVRRAAACPRRSLPPPAMRRPTPSIAASEQQPEPVPQTVGVADGPILRAEAAEARAAELEKQLEGLSATTWRLYERIHAMEEEQVNRLARQRELVAELEAKLPLDPQMKDYANQLAKLHSAEISDLERRHREEIEHVESELAAAHADSADDESEVAQAS